MCSHSLKFPDAIILLREMHFNVSFQNIIFHLDISEIYWQVVGMIFLPRQVKMPFNVLPEYHSFIHNCNGIFNYSRRKLPIYNSLNHCIFYINERLGMERILGCETRGYMNVLEERSSVTGHPLFPLSINVVDLVIFLQFAWSDGKFDIGY